MEQMNHLSEQQPQKGTEGARRASIFRVTMFGGLINTLLVVLKFLAGIFGHSAAMLADAVHSLSDFLTDVIVLVFVRVSDRPADDDHGYGHGKYETLATIIVGLTLLVVGALLAAGGVEDIVRFCRGEKLEAPEAVALWAALASIVLKELTYRVTVRVGHRVDSQVVVANAWHHRSDALSSVGTAVGIGGAIWLGPHFVVLDPIAAVVVSIFIIAAAVKVCQPALDELLEHSLPDETLREIEAIVAEDKALTGLHHLRTRRIGGQVAIEMHLRMPGSCSLYEAHRHSMFLEQRLKERFGARTHVGIHIEPIKQDGEYQAPE